jgi:hypothetical protein
MCGSFTLSELAWSKVKASEKAKNESGQAPSSSKVNYPVKYSVKYPFISSLNGSISVGPLHGVQHPARLNESLQNSAEIHAAADSQARIEIDPQSSITLLENSEVQIPLIQPESGEVTQFDLQHGRLRLDLHGPSERVTSTPVSRDVYKDVNFLLSYEPQKALAQVSVFSGTLAFRGIEGEFLAELGAGQEAHFQGVLEDGAPSFDILLHGRKVARGQLSQATTLQPRDFALLQTQTLVQKPPPPKPPPVPKPKPGQICKEPFAKLNECAWWWNSKTRTCKRELCNASGEWQDPFVYPQGQGPCLTIGHGAVVGACDY